MVLLRDVTFIPHPTFREKGTLFFPAVMDFRGGGGGGGGGGNSLDLCSLKASNTGLQYL